jgi:uncharacterized repeat protein (TIGR01451 family)
LISWSTPNDTVIARAMSDLATLRISKSEVAVPRGFNLKLYFLTYSRPSKATPFSIYIRLFGLFLLAIGVAAALPVFTSATRQGNQEASSGSKNRKSEAVPGELIVRFRADSPSATKTAQMQQLDVAGKGQISMRVEALGAADIVEGLRLVHVATEDTASALEALRARPDVIYAEPNFIRRKSTTPNDPGYTDLWALRNIGQNGGTPGVDIGAEQAWDTTTGSRSIVVAVIDEGIDINHPDLQPNIWRNPTEVAGNGIDDDGNGYVDDLNGYDFFHNDASVYDGPGTNPDGSPIDEHGTHVAGTIGATGNNAIGVVGVNWQVSLMSLKFLGPDGGSSADLLKAYTYAKVMRDLWISSGGTKGANIRVANNSYGGGEYSQAESDAIQALGTSDILFVVAAGNEAEDNNVVGSYPANYDLPNIISVAATDRQGLFASFSNKGTRTVHLGAPGVSINSTRPGNSYGYHSGTSMASPQVAGTAALVLAAHPQMNTARLRGAVLFGGTPSAPLDDTTITGRGLNAAGSLQNANEVDTTAPAVISNLSISGQDGRTVVLNWTAPGDDGNSGQASLYEIRFVDGATNARFLQAVLRPPVAGTPQTLGVNIPYRHASGSLVIRTIDNVGNSSDSSIAVSVSAPEVSDPYTVTASATEPLSTGGQALGITFDDYITSFSLPFNFPYYQRTYNIVAVSSNGTLYLGTPPGPDPFSFGNILNGRNVIAGLWDDLDLRRCFRADSDVYKVTPDSDRVIFRWQGVRFNDSICPGSPNGLEPINFEIELRRDGVIKMRYGQNTPGLPVVGIGGGEPEGYVVASHTASDSPKDLTNAQTLTFTLRRQPDVTDLSLSSVASAGYVPYGQNVSFTLTATNRGPTRTSGVYVIDTLPFGAIFVSCTAPQGSCSTPKNGLLRVDFPLLELGATATYTIVVQPGPTASSPFINHGSVKGPISDPTTNNNDADSVVQVFFPNQNPQTGLIGIGAGGNQSFAIRTDRYGLAWGANGAGQLGDGSIQDKWVPVRIYGTLNLLAAIEGGFAHTLALKQDGSVWSWGANNKGQLGDGTVVDHKLPARISGLANITKLSGGGSHSLALRSDGTVWAWGDNSSGQLGDGTNNNRSVPVQVQGLTNVVAIAAGYNHSLAVKNDGSVWAWGANESGQLGETPSGFRLTAAQVNGISNAVAVTAGDGYQYFGGGPTTISFSVVVKNDGTVWTWGNNFEGQLGDGTSNNLRSTPGQVVGLSGVTTVAAGANHVLALRNDGTVWAWGDNDNGALGDTTRTDRKTPVQVVFLTGIQAIGAGYQHSLALRQDGHVFGWGSYTYGQLGFGGSAGVREFPYEASAQVPDAPPIGTISAPTFSPDGGSFFGSQNVGVSSTSSQTVFTNLSAGYQHVLTRMSDGGVYGWGYNLNGQLGLDPGFMYQGVVVLKTPRRFPELDDAAGVAAGGTHSLAVKNNGAVFSWGSNFGGELGYDTSHQLRFTPTQVPGVSGIVAVAAGNQSVAMRNDGIVFVWGGPQLIQTPTQVAGLNNVASIACGNVTFAVRNDGTVWGWGRNPNGELGDGSQADHFQPVQAVGLSNVVAVASGGGHSVALRSDGSVWTWGNNFYGQLGLGNFSSQPQLTPVPVSSISGVIAVAAGSNYTLALKSDGTVWAWGANHHGQLGYTGVNQVSPTQISGLANITAIAAGFEFAMARRGDGALFTWGDNQSSQLGDGTTDSQSGLQQMIQLYGGIEIHYTTNGSDPTLDDPLVGSGSVLVDHSLTLKARAFKYGWLPSTVKSASFSISNNQIDETTFFVRQHYLDFLSRDADPDGLAFWVNNINSCGTDNACREVKRIDTSAAYFLSIEFQETGYLVHRFYRASFGRRPLFSEFLPDTQAIGNGVVVNSPGWQQRLESNKVAFANAWVTKPAFTAIYNGLSNTQFVDALIANTGVTFTPTDRQSYIDVLNNPGTTRAQVLRAIAENHDFYNAEYNPAFVEMQYFGYLRRDPDTGGFNFWLNKLLEHGGDFRAAEMVKSFLVSGEYRQRFGTP